MLHNEGVPDDPVTVAYHEGFRDGQQNQRLSNAADSQLAEERRRLLVDLTRCEHGRIQGDVCSGCPDGLSPSQEGRHLGYSLDGTYLVVVPSRNLATDPGQWYAPRSRVEGK